MSVAGLRVRVAGAADLARVVEMERTSREAPHWAETEYAAIVRVNRDVDGVDGKDGMVKRRLLVAEAGERLVGFVVGKVVGSGEGSFAELESVVVEAAARRRGVGRALCEAVIAWCREQGAAELELEVRAGSDGAVALYAGLGFTAVGRREGYYREPVEDAVMMRLELG
jgi:[ribosomal protein S18]-alanine N-acetyltransferase